MVATAKTPVRKARIYRAVNVVHHDGEVYQPGKTIALTADEAASLLAVGAVAEKAAPKPKDAPKEGKPEAADRQGTADK